MKSQHAGYGVMANKQSTNLKKNYQTYRQLLTSVKVYWNKPQETGDERLRKGTMDGCIYYTVQFPFYLKKKQTLNPLNDQRMNELKFDK